MEFQDVVRRRRMVRGYDPRPVPPEITERIVRNALRAPSAGFSQGWGFLVLDTPADIGRYHQAMRTAPDADNWLAADVNAPLLIIPHANKNAYLDRYAQPDKGFTDRSEAWWPAPYWDIDTGMATLLMLLTTVDAGLGACFFGMPTAAIEAYRTAFGVPREFTPIGAVSIGYPADPGPDPKVIRSRRRGFDDVVHNGRWGTALPTTGV